MQNDYQHSIDLCFSLFLSPFFLIFLSRMSLCHIFISLSVFLQIQSVMMGLYVSGTYTGLYKSCIFTGQWCQIGSVGSVFAAHAIGCGFVSQVGRTKDHHKNSTNCLPAWHASISSRSWK